MLKYTHSLPSQELRLFSLVNEPNPPVPQSEYHGVPIEFGRVSPHARHNQPIEITADEMPDSFSQSRVLPTVSAMLDQPKYCSGKGVNRKLPRIGHAQFGQKSKAPYPQFASDRCRFKFPHHSGFG
jgi:hypothetical protein